jgi:hypothetical protein
MDNLKDQIKETQASADALTATVSKLYQKLGDLQQQQMNMAQSGQNNSRYYETLTGLIDKYKIKIDSTSNSLSATNKILNDQERVLAATQSRTQLWGTAYEGATGKVKKLSEASDFLGKTLGTSANGFKPFAEHLQTATEVMSPLKDGISKANQAYTVFREGMASGKGVMESLKGVMPGLTGGLQNFKVALAETGIGLIIIAVAALVEKLQEFKPLMDWLTAAAAAAGAVMSQLGNLILHPVESLKNMSGGMVQAAKDAFALAQAQEKLKTTLSAQEVANKSIEDQIDLLKQQTENTKLNLAEREKALQKAQAMEQQNFNTNKKLTDQARANAIEDARINGNLNDKELAALIERGTQYAQEMLSEGKINQAQFDAIKKADMDIISLRKEHRDSSKTLLDEADKLAQEKADKKKARDEAAAKAEQERAAKRREARQREQEELSRMNEFIKQADGEVAQSKMRQAQELMTGYTLEISNTTQHYADLISTYQTFITEYEKLSKNDPRYAKQHKKQYEAAQGAKGQLTDELNGKLAAITGKFEQDGLGKLNLYSTELQKIGKTAQQIAEEQLEADYKKQVDDVKTVLAQNTDFNNSAQKKLKNFKDKTLNAEQQKRKKELEDVQVNAQANINKANDILSQLETKNGDDKKSLKQTFDNATTQDKKEGLEGDITEAQSKGDWQKEFQHRQELLDLETKQATDAAGKKEGAINKIKEEAKVKQTQLDKARQAAEANQQKQYLQSADRMATALGSIFGKNTIAARVAFKAHQAAAAAQVIIDTRTAIMGIWKANSGIPFVGVPKAIAETVIVAATGAANLASIMKQKPGFARGGQFTSDGRGALLPGYSRTDNTNAYLRSGEAVVVSEAMRNPWARNLVSAINVMHGGRDFSIANPGRGYAIGGIFTDGGNANRYYSQPMHDQQDLANTLAYQMINNFPPIYVDVKDVNNQQNILAQTVNRVNL